MQTTLLKKEIFLIIIILLIGMIVFSSSGAIVKKQFLESYENFGFGYRLYDPSSQYDPGPVFFKLDDPGTVYTLAYDNNTITGGCYNPYTYTWYVCDDLGKIWTIDIWSGDMTPIGGDIENLGALAYDPQTDTIYGAYQDFLYGIDMQTGYQLWAWSISDIFDISGMVANGFGNLFIVDKILDDLWRLDINTLLPTLIGSLSIDIVGNADLEFDFNTEILYMSAYTTTGELYKINTWFGDATLIGNFEEGARISGFIIPWNWPPSPPEPPMITGPECGKINVEYEYSFVSIDPDDDLLTYIIDWGDGNIVEHGLYPAGEKITVKHEWSEEGNYNIKAKVREISGLESSWNYLDVTMPKKYIPIWWLSDFLTKFPLIKLLLEFI
jgi:hypothetical protein